MKIALARCENLPYFESDDQLLWTTLKSLEIEIDCPVWDDALVDWAQYDLIIPRLTWDYQEKMDAFQAWLVKYKSKFLNPYEVLDWNFSKSYLAELNCPLVPTIFLNQRTGDQGDLTMDEFKDIYQKLVDFIEDTKNDSSEQGAPIIFAKPMIGANSVGTLRISLEESNQAQLFEHLSKHLPYVGMLLQPYQASIESDGEFSLIFFDGKFSHAVQKKPMPGDYKAQIDYGAKDSVYEPSQTWIDESEKLVASVQSKFNLSEPLLYARCDYLLSSKGMPLLIELELIEPSLFFRGSQIKVDRFVTALLKRKS